MAEAQEVATIDEPREVAPAITPMQMLQMAVEQGADLDKLTKLMDLQERWEANEARKAFVAALSAFKANPPTIKKNRHVKYEGSSTEYDHATLDQVSGVIGKALTEHGLSHRWEVEQPEGGDIRVTCVLTHVQGHSERVTLKAGADNSGKKNNIQAIGSAVTYLQRYSLLAATGLATEDMDNDGEGLFEYVTEEQADTIQALAEDVGADKDAFLKFMNAATYSTILASKYDNAIAALEKKRGK